MEVVILNHGNLHDEPCKFKREINFFHADRKILTKKTEVFLLFHLPLTKKGVIYLIQRNSIRRFEP